MNSIKHLPSAIVALILYFVIPYGYNIVWCIVCFVIFLYISYDLLKDDFKHKDYLSFNSVFLISFFLTSFAFPVFVLSSDAVMNDFIDLNYLVQFVDLKYISRGVFLCLLAVSIYAIAFNSKKVRSKSLKDGIIRKRIFKKNTVDCWLAIALLWTIYNAFTSLQTYGVTNLQQNGYVYDILKASLIVSFLAHLPKINSSPATTDNFSLFFRNNMFPLIVSVISILLFLYFGVRNFAISLFLIDIIVMVYYYTKLSLKYVLIFSVVGTVILFVIRETRHSDNSIMNSGVASAISGSNVGETPVLLLFSDLIGACQELSLGVEIKDKKGYQNPEQIVLLPFLPLPKVPSLVSEALWNESYKDATSANIINDYMLNANNKHSTYGKHCVSDLYMKWGVIGIIVSFFLLGRIVAFADRNKRNNYFYAAMAITLVSLSLFLARGSLIDLIRPISYGCFLILIFSKNIKSTNI